MGMEKGTTCTVYIEDCAAAVVDVGLGVSEETAQIMAAMAAMDKMTMQERAPLLENGLATL
jgi:tartrate dehydratase alpha subunit/fumarate hydratase class I-like protein